MIARRLDRLFVPVDIAPLVYARIVFGVVMLVEVCRFASYGWIRRYYVEPTFTFSYPGFGWVKPLPGPGMYVVFAVLGGTAVMIALGLFYRVAVTVFAVAITYVFLLDQTHYLNHMYLICLLAALLAVVPAASAASIDARWKRTSVQTVPAWCVWLLCGQIAVVYVFGGIAKLDGDWLSGVPAGMFLDNIELTESLARSELGRKAFAISGLLFDLLIVPALLWRRTRLLATVAALAFHLSNFKLFQIGIFPWLMLALTPMFWPPAWTRRLLAFLRLLPREIRPEPPAPPVTARPWVIRGLAAYAAFQLFMPLRHWLYPGEVNWTEEGHNFSWHMKLRVKSGTTRFVARDKATGATKKIAPSLYLTRRQAKKMATRPEMIRQFAHEIARRLQEEGWNDVEVRAIASARLNGRPMQSLIDPEVDLAARSFSLLSADWIVPFERVPLELTWEEDEDD